MEFRLLIDADALDFLQSLPMRQRRHLYLFLREIQKFPGNRSEFTVRDEEERTLDVATHGAFRIYYWTDAADRHVKILEIEETD